MTKSSITSTQRSLREVIADDSHALTFQTSGQYRAALLKHEPMEHTHRAEAFAWAVFAKDDNVIIWSKNRAQVESASKEYGRPIVPVIALSAAEQGAGPVPPTHCDPAEGFCAKCRERERSALAAQQAAAPDAMNAARYLAWRNALVADDKSFSERMEAALPAEVGVKRRPTAGEWDAAIDAAALSAPGTQEAPAEQFGMKYLGV